MLVLGGWLAGSVWLFVVNLRHRWAGAPLSPRPQSQGRAKQS